MDYLTSSVSNDTQENDLADLVWSVGQDSYESVAIEWCLFQYIVAHTEGREFSSTGGSARLREALEDLIEARIAAAIAEADADTTCTPDAAQMDPNNWKAKANYSQASGNTWQTSSSGAVGHPLFNDGSGWKVAVSEDGGDYFTVDVVYEELS